MKPGLPIVTLLLIAANIAAAFFLLIQPDMAYDFGFRPNQPKIQSAFTSLFLHANVLHLLGNMLFLAAVGAAVELATGSARFAIVYFVSGLAGVLLHFAMTRSAADPVPYIGASGAIAGCAAYYTIRYTSLRIPVVPHVALPVLAITVAWLLLQIGGAFIRIGESAGVAYWAHLGGFAAGLVLSFAFRAPDLGQVKLAHEALNTAGGRSAGALATAAERHLEAHPEDKKALRDLANAYEKMAEPAKEADVLVRLVDVSAGEEQAEAVQRLAKAGYVSKLSTLRRLQLADQHSTVARALLKSVIEGPEDVQKPEAMLALAGVEREKDPEAAARILRELEEKYPLHPAVDLARKRGWLT